MAFGIGARFCPGCRAPLEQAEPAARARPGEPKRPAFDWSATVSVPLGAGDEPSDADTTQDGLRRFVAWRNYVAGVLDTAAGPLGVFIRFPHSQSAGPAAGAPADSVAAAGDRGPEVRTLLLEATPRRPGRLSSNAQAEPVIVQGLVLIALRSRVLAVDLFAEELSATPVVQLESGSAFAGRLHLQGHPQGEELLAVVRTAAGPRIVTLQPARDEAGVISLKAEWAWKAAPAEAEEGTFGAGPFTGFRRAMFVGDAVFLPGKDVVLVATLTPYGQGRGEQGSGEEGAPAGGLRWVWRRQGLHEGQRSFADARFAWGLGDAAGAEPVVTGNDRGDFDYGEYRDEYGDDEIAEDHASAARAFPAGRAGGGMSAGILLKEVDAGDEPTWSLLRPEADGRLTFRHYPEAEVIVAGGRIFGISRKSYLTEVQEADDVGGPKSSRITVSGAAVDRLLPVRDDLVALVRDGQALKLWAYNSFGSLRGQAEGGQKLLGEGESLCPPVLMDDRLVCLWTDSTEIFVAAAKLTRK